MSQSTSRSEGAHSPLREVAEQLRRFWWIPLLTGLVSIGLGLAILATDWTVQALVVITGLVFIIRGIALAFSPSYAGRTSGEQVVAGIAGVIAGIVLVAWPGPSLLVLAFFVGAWLAVSGGFHIVTSISRRRELPHWGFTVAVGVIELLLGIWAMRRPEVTLALLITIIGLWAVVTGSSTACWPSRSTATPRGLAMPRTAPNATRLSPALARRARSRQRHDCRHTTRRSRRVRHGAPGAGGYGGVCRTSLCGHSSSGTWERMGPEPATQQGVCSGSFTARVTGDLQHHRRLGAVVAQPCAGNTFLSRALQNRFGQAEPDLPVVDIDRAPHIPLRCWSTFATVAHRTGWAVLL